MRSFYSRSKYAILVAMPLALVLGLLVLLIAASRPDRYEAELPLVITPNAALAEPSDVNFAQDVLSRQTVTNTFAVLLESGGVHGEAVEQTGVTPADALSYEFSAAAAPDASVVTVSVMGPDPASAAELVDAVADVGVGYFADLYPHYEVTVVQSAAIPTDPVGFRPWQLALIAAVAGAVVGGLLGSRVDDHRRSDASVVDTT